MIGTLAWKEYREQRPVWLAMAVLGLVLPVVLLAFLDPVGGKSPDRTDDVLGTIAVVVAFTYGLVCGAMLLAGEHESRTMTFLDFLEGRRARLWITKVLMGTILTIAQALLLAGLAVGLGAGPPEGFPGGWFAIAALYGLAGLAWGLLGSALCRSVLAAVGVTALLFAFVFPPGMLLVQVIGRHHSPDLILPLGAVALTVAALAASGLIFCGPDWKRRPAGSLAARMVRWPDPSGVRTVLWLTWRQAPMGVVFLGAGAMVLGAIVPANGLILWPVVTLLLGVGCGMGVFAGEQAAEAQRFLGDQRLPVGRIWVVKTVCWLIGAVVLATLTFLTASSRLSAIAAQRFHDGVTGSVVEQLAGREILPYIGLSTFLILGLAYGFAFGQFFTLLARKNAVAAVLAVLVGAVAISLWVPSLVSGGIELWQVLVVPALLLASLRPVLWAWAGGRLHTPRPMLMLAGGGTLAAAWMAGTFWYRAVAIPDVGEPFDVRAFLASLPTPEQNEAGRLIRRAAEELTKYEKEVSGEFKPPAKPQGAAPPPRPQPGALDKAAAPGPEEEPPRPFVEQIDDVLEKGWPKDRPVLSRWLDRMFEGQWAAQFREAARLPLGMLVDLRTANSNTLLDYLQGCRQAAYLFTARALQLQAQGDRKAALDHLVVVLGLSRQLRHKTISLAYLTGAAAQTAALAGFKRWLRDLGPRPELLRSALTELNRHEAQLPPFVDYLKAAYLVALNDRESRTALLARGRSTPGSAEMMLFALASKMPWEEQRETRLLHVLAVNALREAERPLWEGPAGPDGLVIHIPRLDREDLPINVVRASYLGMSLLFLPGMRQTEARSLCQLRGTRLTIALALYEVEQGRPAATLDALVPRYLPALPLDPYSGQSFHYRVSKGEQIEKEAAEPGEAAFMKVGAGQGVIWSVGPDHQDNGGTRDGSGTLGHQRGLWSARSLDWIFLVPRWAGKTR
jgi:ABC-type transport system involved in multi-copper enzyme maturation permease subunit